MATNKNKEVEAAPKVFPLTVTGSEWGYSLLTAEWEPWPGPGSEPLYFSSEAVAKEYAEKIHKLVGYTPKEI